MKYIILILLIPIISFILTNIDSTIREGRYAHIRNMKLKWNHLDLLDNVQGDNYLKVNSIGLKGDEIGNEKYRILVIGNSLSEGMLLDDSETWPYQMQTLLRNNGLDIKVFNSAKSGFMSAQRAIDIYEAYKQYQFDLVIIYPLGPYNSNYSPREGFTEFYIPDYKNTEFSLKNNTVIQQLRNRKWEIASYFKKRFNITLFRNAIADPNHVRGIQSSADYRKSLPVFNLNSQHLNQYIKKHEKGLQLVKDYFNQNNINTLFVNRLHIANLNPGPEDLKLWWHDTIVDDDKIEKRYSVEDFSKLLNIEHQLMNQLQTSKVKVITQPMIKPGLNWFYDHNHFNEHGAKEFAKALSKYVTNYFN